jgi:hypothetical protein
MVGGFLCRTVGKENPLHSLSCRSPQMWIKGDGQKTPDLGVSRSCPLHVHQTCGYVYHLCGQQTVSYCRIRQLLPPPRVRSSSTMDSGCRSIGKVISCDEAESGMHSLSREAGLTWLWWIQGAISVIFNCCGGRQNNNKRASPMEF